MDNEPRFEDLEAKIAFLEHTLSTLNDVVAGQQKHIEMLDKNVRLMAERIKDLSSQPAGGQTHSAADEKPPHY